MITQADWQEVNEQWMADERLRLGEPPTADEMLAYTRGELSPDEEERVRSLLAVYPELARTLSEPFPEAAKAGEADFMSAEELSRHWAALRERLPNGPVVAPNVAPAVAAGVPSNVTPMRPAAGSAVQFWRYAAAIAATVAAVLGALLMQARSESRGLAAALVQPRVKWEEQLLQPDGARRGGGEGSPLLSTQGDLYLLVAPLSSREGFASYRLSIVAAGGNAQAALWQSGAMQPGGNDAFEVLVPRRFLAAGKYQLLVHGVNGAREERLASYSFRVPER